MLGKKRLAEHAVGAGKPQGRGLRAKSRAWFWGHIDPSAVTGFVLRDGFVGPGVGCNWREVIKMLLDAVGWRV